MEDIETKLATHLYSQSHSGTLFQFLQKIYPIKKMSALAKRIRRLSICWKGKQWDWGEYKIAAEKMMVERYWPRRRRRFIIQKMHYEGCCTQEITFMREGWSRNKRKTILKTWNRWQTILPAVLGLFFLCYKLNCVNKFLSRNVFHSR